MPIAIGAKPRSTFTDPIGLLTDCHRRMEKTGALEDKHEEATRGHAEIEHLGRKWLAAESLTLADRTRFAELVAELGDLYRGAEVS